MQATDSKLTDEQKAAKARDLDDKKKLYDREQQDDQTDFTQGMQELFQQTASKVEDVLTDYARKHGFTLVLDVDNSKENPVLYVGSPAMDITREVIAAYNGSPGYRLRRRRQRLRASKRRKLPLPNPETSPLRSSSQDRQPVEKNVEYRGNALQIVGTLLLSNRG